MTVASAVTSGATIAVSQGFRSKATMQSDRRRRADRAVSARAPT